MTVASARSGDDRSMRLDGLEVGGASENVTHLPGVLDRESLVERIRASVIGDDTVLDGPFGGRRLVYADYTASGRALSFVESFIREEVLPLYANTHTDASATGRRMTRLREDARRLIHRSVGGSRKDVVVFCGTGSTGAIDKLVQVLALRIPAALDDRYGLSKRIPEAERPVVFVGPYEHHSNELPWRESIADVVAIGLDADGGIDLVQLEEELRRHAGRLVKIGSFSAASNVTGIVTDVDRVSALLHRHGALSCWDYASAGPYLPIEMNPSSHRLAYKDAVFLSPHKFVGGPGTPGVLVAKRSLFRNEVPAVPAGGTISFVSPTGHSYHPDPEVREEGGTPAIVESIRAGLVFALKDAIGTGEIRRRERDFARRALDSWRENPRIELLGNLERERLAIVSFGLRHPPGLLHSNFVAAVLNDLFGIQARSGCFCAGPYLHRIYGIDARWSRRMSAQAERSSFPAMVCEEVHGAHDVVEDGLAREVVEAHTHERDLRAEVPVPSTASTRGAASGSTRADRPGGSSASRTSPTSPGGSSSTVRAPPSRRASCRATSRMRPGSSARSSCLLRRAPTSPR